MLSNIRTAKINAVKSRLIDSKNLSPDAIVKRKFLRWLRENNVPYDLHQCGTLTLGAANCSFRDIYLHGSFGSLAAGNCTDFRVALCLDDFLRAYNRFVFINNRFVTLSCSFQSYRLAPVELPEILR